MWASIVDATLNFFQQIGEFANWLFQPIRFNIPSPDGIWANIFGWLVDFINSIDVGITPISIFTIGGFVLVISIGILKMVL